MAYKFNPFTGALDIVETAASLGVPLLVNPSTLDGVVKFSDTIGTQADTASGTYNVRVVAGRLVPTDTSLTDAILIGEGVVGSNDDTVIGANSSSTGVGGNVVLGEGCTATGQGSVLLGQGNTDSGFDYTICFGPFNSPEASNQAVFSATHEMYLGDGVSNKSFPSEVIYTATGGQSAGARTGTAVVLASGKAYGSAAIKPVYIRVSESGGAGVNPLQNHTIFQGDLSLELTGEITTPATNPAANGHKLYFKSDDVLYSLNDAGTEVAIGSGSGDVVGPASATDNAIARYDTTTGKLIQDSLVSIDDVGTIQLVNGSSFGPSLEFSTNTGMYSPGTGQISFAASAVDALNLKFISAGIANVGINGFANASAQVPLQILRHQNSNTAFVMTNSIDGNVATAQIDLTASGSRTIVTSAATSYSNAEYAARSIIENATGAGLNLVSVAGDVRVYAGGTTSGDKVATFNADQTTDFLGDITTTGNLSAVNTDAHIASTANPHTVTWAQALAASENSGANDVIIDGNQSLKIVSDSGVIGSGISDHHLNIQNVWDGLFTSNLVITPTISGAFGFKSIECDTPLRVMTKGQSPFLSSRFGEQSTVTTASGNTDVLQVMTISPAAHSGVLRGGLFLAEASAANTIIGIKVAGLNAFGNIDASRTTDLTSTSTFGGICGGRYVVRHHGQCNVVTASGVSSAVRVNSAGTSTISEFNSFLSEPYFAGSGTIENYYGFCYKNPTSSFNSTEFVGYKCEALSGATNMTAMGIVGTGVSQSIVFNWSSGGSHNEKIYSSATGILDIHADTSIDLNTTLNLIAGTTTKAPLNIPAGTAKTTPIEGDLEYVNGHLLFRQKSQYGIAMATGVKTTTTTVVNTVTETELYGYTFQADELHVDQVVNVNLSGVVSTATASDDYTIRFKVGGTTFHTLNRVKASSVTGVGWESIYRGTIRVEGASGTFVDFSKFVEDQDGYVAGDTTEHSIDTTGSVAFSVTIQWDNAKAGNTFSCTQGFLTLLH